MAATSGPQTVTNGLVLHLDAANNKNSLLTDVEYLIVAGGGSAGGNLYHNGGGGAGGLLTGTTAVTPQAYTVTVGAGGVPGSTQQRGNQGQNSSAFSLVAIGGGSGGNYFDLAGGNGGSGGGAGGSNGSNATGGSGTAGQGNNGGNGNQNNAGGGGGAGSAGENGSDLGNFGGDGGIGVISYITGTGTYYAGGGGGAGYATETPGTGGLGGGGDGNSTTGNPGTPNTGGGGGAPERNSSTNLGAGGSGIVVIRYPGPQRATGGTVTQVGGDTVHTFTTVGNSTFTVLPALTNAAAFAGASDLSGLNNFATAVNGPVYTSDNGGAFVFDGVNDYGRIQYGSAFNVLTTPFTVIVWNKKNNTTNGYNGLITADLASDNTWKIFKDVNETFYKSRSGGTILAFPNYTVNQWHMYAFTKSGSTLTNYFDGSLTASNNAASNPATFSNDLAIGSYRLNDAIAGAHLMNQSFGPIMFYNRALTAAEVQQNFEAIRGRFGI